MNFSPFGNPFQTNLPSMHQFATKFAEPVIVNNTGQNTVMVTAIAGDSTTGGIQYLPVSTTNSSIVNATPMQNSVSRIATLPSNIQVVNTAGAKYSSGQIMGWENIHIPVHHFTAVDPKMVSSVPYSQQGNVIHSGSSPTVWPVRLINSTAMNSEHMSIEYQETEPQDLCKNVKDEKDVVKNEKMEEKIELIQFPLQGSEKFMTWSDGTGTAVADYLSRLPTTSIPISLHHFLKYSSDSGKKEGMQELTLISEHQISHHSNDQDIENTEQHLLHHQQHEEESEVSLIQPSKKKKKKQKVKEKKPKYRPGEIRLSTALDGSMLFCCPECHMAYPERFSLEQHLSGHKMERRFVCDVCGAGLKRKEHLDQHKRGHSQERPFVCSICLKGFKRNEHLTRHYVIHSGDKGHVCGDCGKAFSRKDHLHKHAQTHIAKRVKAELSQQGLPLTPSVLVPAPSMS